MTHDEAVNEQKRLARVYGKDNLSWWFGTRCEKCCDVYPRFYNKNTNDKYHTCGCDVYD